MLGLTADGGIKKIGYLDSCEPKFPFIDNGVPIITSIKNLISENINKFDLITIISYDSAVCGDPTTIRTVFKNSGLDVSSQINFQMPYIATIDKEREIKEFIGESQSTIVVSNANIEFENITKNVKPSIFRLFEQSILDRMKDI